jgi:hypothetical protein
MEPRTAAVAEYARWYPLYKTLYPALRELSHAVANQSNR